MDFFFYFSRSLKVEISIVAPHSVSEFLRRFFSWVSIVLDKVLWSVLFRQFLQNNFKILKTLKTLKTVPCSKWPLGGSAFIVLALTIQ